MRPKYALVLACLALLCAQAHASTGYVVRRVSSCDYFLVETPRGFAVLELYGGHDPDTDDKIVGAFENYGMKTVFDETSDEEIRVWVEDYGLSKTRGLELLLDKCE